MVYVNLSTIFSFTLMNKACDGLGEILGSSLWLLIPMICFFYGMFIYDILGGEVGIIRAIWAPAFMLLLAFLVYAIKIVMRRLFYYYKWKSEAPSFNAFLLLILFGIQYKGLRKSFDRRRSVRNESTRSRADGYSSNSNSSRNLDSISQEPSSASSSSASSNSSFHGTSFTRRSSSASMIELGIRSSVMSIASTEEVLHRASNSST